MSDSFEADPAVTGRIAPLIRELLVAVGEDPDRTDLQKTPARVGDAWQEFTRGYAQNPVALLQEGAFDDDAQGLVVVRDIELFSLCEHHLVPFFGRAHVGYVPDGKVVGLSKIGRAVDALARRLQVQERLTAEVCQALTEAVAPKGVAVVIEAQHLCMMMRGSQKTQSSVITSQATGILQHDSAARAEFNARISLPEE